MINGTIEADIHYVDMLRGKDGESAFQLAVDQGYTGTLDEWLASLKGEKGEQGAKGDKGDTGEQGAKGDKGDKGDTGEKGADGYTPVKGTDYFTDADKTELVTSVKTEVEPLITAEATTRATADTAINTSMESLNEKLSNRITAMMNARAVEIQKTRFRLGNYEDIEYLIQSLNIRDSATYVDAVSVFGATQLYYTDFDIAITDFNAGVTTNGNTSSNDAVCSISLITNEERFKETIPVLKLTADITRTTNQSIEITHNGYIDLNGHIINMTNSKIFIKYPYNVVIYGQKENSRIDFVATNEYNQNVYGIHAIGNGLHIIGGTYTLTSSAPKLAYLVAYYANYILDNQKQIVDFECINAILTVEADTKQTAFTTTVYAIFIKEPYVPANITVKNSNITVNGHDSTTGGIKIGGLWSYVNVENCNISANGNGLVGANNNDNTGSAIDYTGLYTLIDKCILDATNCAANTVGGVIRNSILSGGVHGGIYNTLSSRRLQYRYKNKEKGEGLFLPCNSYSYLQNCTIKKVNKDIVGDSYPYACYISGNIWFDGCTFENEVEGQYKAPAIKKQPTQAESPMPYFSNCEIGDKIRIDSGCNAYFGKGMRKDMTVMNGGTLHYTDDTYASMPVVTTVYVDPPTEETTTTAETSSS